MTTDPSVGPGPGPYPGHHLAQVNVGLAAYPLDSPEMADFTDNLDLINGLGKSSPGFVWLLEGDSGYGATDIAWPDDPEAIVNMSVWESVEALRAYVFQSDHVAILRRRREFFKPMGQTSAALWWIPAGTIPTVLEAAEHVAHLEANGPTPYAFTFQRPFAPEES